jgi:hypothetical protein
VQLQQMLINLIMYGLQSMASVIGKRELIVQSCVDPEGNVVVAVKDSGSVSARIIFHDCLNRSLRHAAPAWGWGWLFPILFLKPMVGESKPPITLKAARRSPSASRHP